MMSPAGSTGEHSAQFHIWVRVMDRHSVVTRDEFVSFLGFHIMDYLYNYLGIEVTLPDLFRLGLTESVHDDNRYRTYHGREWDIEEITLDPKTSCYFALDSDTKEKHLILLYFLLIFGAGTSSVNRVEGNPFRFGGRGGVLPYMQVDAWCRQTPGRALKIVV